MLTIKQKLLKSDLFCCICLDQLTIPIIQCSTGTHFVCHTCKSQIKWNCPVCITSNLFPNPFLEKQLSCYFTACLYCNQQHLKWNIKSHLESCEYRPFNCFLCSLVIPQDTLLNHITSACNIQWIKQTSIDTSGSLGLLPHISNTPKGLSINLKDINQHFAIILETTMILFKRDTTWMVILVDANESSIKIKYNNTKQIIHSSKSIINPITTSLPLTTSTIQVYKKNALSSIDILLNQLMNQHQ